MANFNSACYASTPTRQNLVGLNFVNDTVAVTGQAASDTLTMVKLPVDASLRAILISGTAALFGTSCTLQFGDGTTAARFGSISLGAVAPNDAVVSLDTTKLTAATNLVITISAASGAAGAQTVRVGLIYDIMA